MATTKLNNCSVGFELAGDRIRVAAVIHGSPGSRSNGSASIRYDEIVIPEVADYAPAGLPPPSILVPRFKQSMSRLGIGRGRAAIAVGGRHLVLRYFVGRDNEPVRTELQQATRRCANYVQFGQGDRVVGEHLHQMKDGRIHALLGVAAAAAIDPLTKTLDQLGLRVEVIEPALVALTRMASLSGQLNGQTALLVLVDREGIDIGAVSNGHVLFSRRPQPSSDPGLEPPTADQAARLPRELQKMSRHYVRVFGPDHDARTILVHGAEDLIRPYIQTVEGSPDFQTDVLKLNDSLGQKLALPAEDLVSRGSFAVAIGAVAGLISDESNVVGPNLTSESVVKRPPLLEALARSLFWPTLAAILVWCGVWFAVGNLEDAVAKLRIEADHPSPVEIKYRDLQMLLTQNEQRAANLGKLVHAFEDRHWKQILGTIRNCVPDRLWFTRTRLTSERHLIIEGGAYDVSLVYQFRENLQGAPLLDNATIVTTTNTRHGNTIVTEFSLECVVLPNSEVRGPSGP